MTPYEVIRRKRDGGSLAPDELRSFLEAYAQGRVEEYQMAAFLMAVFFVGLNDDELAALVAAWATRSRSCSRRSWPRSACRSR